jgi:hypothetical protein
VDFSSNHCGGFVARSRMLAQASQLESLTSADSSVRSRRHSHGPTPRLWSLPLPASLLS